MKKQQTFYHLLYVSERKSYPSAIEKDMSFRLNVKGGAVHKQTNRVITVE